MDFVRFPLFVLSSAVLAVALVPGERRDTPLEKFKGYRGWILVTPEAIDMTPIIAVSCIGPSPLNSEPNPHISRLFKVYVNSAGRAAMESQGKKPFPVGSMIVKEKYIREPVEKEDGSRQKLSPSAKPILLTAMVKREKGFDPANGDWEYVALAGDVSKKVTEGMKHCMSCHAKQKKTDYVFGNYGSIHHGWGQ